METQTSERNSVTEQPGNMVKNIGNSAEVQPKAPEIPQDGRVWRTCGKCNHKWLGVPSSDKCPKCKKFIGKPKDVKPVKGSGIRVERVGGAIPDITAQPEVRSTAPADIPASTYVDIAAFGFDMVAGVRKKDCWKLTEQEKKSLEPLLKKVGDKWVGQWFDEHPEEGALAICFCLLIAGKFVRDRQETPKQEAQKAPEQKP